MGHEVTSQTKPQNGQQRNDLSGGAPKQQPKKSPPKAPPEMDSPSDLEGLFNRDTVIQRFKAVAAKHIDIEKLIKVALMARSRQFTLAKCTSESFLRCVLECAELGLEPSGKYGGAYLVPRKNKWLTEKAGHDVYECTLVPDYRGLARLAMQSGKVEAVEADVVYANDFLAFSRGMKPNLEHRKLLVGDRGDPVGAWACIYYRGGRVTFEVMRWDEITKIRDKVYDWQKGPWNDWPDRMACKTVVKRALNLAPTSKRARRAIEIDDAHELEGAVVEGKVTQQRAELPSATEGSAMGAAFEEQLKQSKASRVAAELKRTAAPVPAAQQVVDPMEAAPQPDPDEPPEADLSWIAAIDNASIGADADRLAEELRAIPDEEQRRRLMGRLAEKLTPTEPGSEG